VAYLISQANRAVKNLQHHSETDYLLPRSCWSFSSMQFSGLKRMLYTYQFYIYYLLYTAPQS
jgi:hypothetical protein